MGKNYVNFLNNWLNLPQVDILDYLYYSCNSCEIPQVNSGMEENLVSAKNTNSNVNPLMPKIRGFKIASLNIASLPKHIDE